MRRRLLAVAIVLGAALAAWAAGGGDGTVTSAPTIGVALQAAGAGTTITFQLATPGSAAVAVAGIAQDPSSCDDPTIHVQSAAGFTLMPGQPHAETVACPGAAPGMRRCLFHARDAADSDLASFLAVCVSYTAQALSASPPSLAFGNVSVGATTPPQTVTFTNTGSPVSGPLQLQLDDDLDGDFVIQAPCPQDGAGCDAGTVALAHGATLAVQVACRPTTASPPAAHLYASIGGTTLGSPVALSCVAAPVNGPAIALTTTPAPLDLGAIEVTGSGTATGIVHVRNVGGAMLSISGVSVTQVGTDWSASFAPPCSGATCDIPPGGANDLAVTFDPSALGARPATLQIMSNAGNGQATVALAGRGLGATLEDLVDPLTIDLGDVPKAGITSPPYELHLVNRGNRDLTDATVTLSPTSGFQVMPASPTVSHTAGATVGLVCMPGGATGPLSTTVTVSAPDTVTAAPLVFTATCTATDAALVASPSTLPLGEIRTGTPLPAQTIALENVSSSPLTLDGPPALSPAVPALSLTGPAMLSIPAGGGSAAVKLSVATGSDADLTTQITATDSADSGYTLAVPVTGKVVTAAASAPASIELGTFCVGQQTTPTTVALTSSGTATIELTAAPQLAMGAASPFQLAPKAPDTFPALLAPGETAAIDVQPVRRAQPGAVSDFIEWETDAGTAGPAMTAVSATFLDSGAAIAPASLDFGEVDVHLASHDSMPVTIQNCNDTPLALTATIDEPFAFDATELPASLMPGQTATFGVSFHPAEITHYEGHLRIATNGATDGMLSVKLVGDGVAGPGGGDGGGGPGGLPETSFYACSCTSGGPGGALPVALAVMAAIVRRRRRVA